MLPANRPLSGEQQYLVSSTLRGDDADDTCTHGPNGKPYAREKMGWPKCVICYCKDRKECASSAERNYFTWDEIQKKVKDPKKDSDLAKYGASKKVMDKFVRGIFKKFSKSVNPKKRKYDGITKDELDDFMDLFLNRKIGFFAWAAKGIAKSKIWSNTKEGDENKGPFLYPLTLQRLVRGFWICFDNNQADTELLCRYCEFVYERNILEGTEHPDKAFPYDLIKMDKKLKAKILRE